MPSSHAKSFVTRCLVLAVFALLLPLHPAFAQEASGEATPAARIVDRKHGEEAQIRLRSEWFYGTRRAGTNDDLELPSLRWQGVLETRRLIEAQRARRSKGLDAETNYWVSKGPAPSNFGGWAFGTVSGRIAAIDVDWANDILYVGAASGGVWKSTNDGLSWESIFDSAGTVTVGAIAVDPNDPDVLWVGTGENVSGCESYFGVGLLRSADGGSTWEARNGSGSSTLDDLSSFADIVVDPRDSSHIVTGGRIRGCSSGGETSGGLYTSDDGGQTWTERLSSTQIYEIKQDPVVQDTFWAATSSGVYKSTDNAQTWQLQTSSALPSGSTGRTELAIAPSDTNVVYALFASGNSGAEIWRTADGGASWSLRSSGGDACDGQCWYNMVLRVHINDPDIVYRGTIHIFKSTDGAQTWTDLSNNWGGSQKVHQDTHVLVMHPSESETFYVGSDGGIWKSVDGGSNFTNVIGNMGITQFYAIGVDAGDPEQICGGAQDNSSLARTTSDIWDLQVVTGDGFVCHIDPIDNSYAYTTSYPNGGIPSVYRSTSGILGSYQEVTSTSSGINSGDRSNWVTPFILDPTTPSTIYLGTQRVYRSDDHGSNWSPVGPDDMTNGGTLVSLEVNRSFPDIVYAGSNDGRVWRSTNRGIDWMDLSAGLPGRSINDIAADPTREDRIFATVGGFNTAHLWEWTLDEGWVARGEGLPNVPANSVLALSAGDVIVGVDTGVFRSQDGGQSFVPYMEGLPEGLVVTDLKWNAAQSILTAGTYGRGAWQVQVDPVEPIVLFDSIELPLTEIDGDGDENVEPGETWGVRPLLRNAGGQTALGVSARLATATPGVTIEDGGVGAYGDIAGGAAGGASELQHFVVEPGFDCGSEIVFDLVDIVSDNAPGSYNDKLAAFTVTVVNDYEPSTFDQIAAEDFSGGASDWTHNAIDPGIYPTCYGQIFRDEWNLRQKDATHGTSYHLGKGPGRTYSRTNYAWLHYYGKDSAGGSGLVIPADAFTASMTVTHWYDTRAGEDGGRVVIDALENGQDVYQTLKPVGGYPSGTIVSGQCNGLEGGPAFMGNSGGWVTSTFDLTPFKGQRVWIAFVFGSDRQPGNGEGWYIDDISIDTETLGSPLCDVIDWPGLVPESALFERLEGGDLRATWSASCNEGSPEGQSYSIQAGDLAALASEGAYAHAPVAGACTLSSPHVFTPGSGSEYFLVVANQGGREGGAGSDSTGNPRPHTSAACGEPREGACP